MKERIKEKIRCHKIVVGIMGLGYVGLPLAVECAKAGFKTIGFDIQKEKVLKVNEAKSYIKDVNDIDLDLVYKNGMLQATADFSLINKVDFIIICVPTPLDEHQQPNISCIQESALFVARYLKKESVVILESTTFPGTTEDILRPILESESELKCGLDFYVGFSPERVDPGNPTYHTKNTPKVVGGIGEEATSLIAYFYKNILESEIYQVSSPAVAEMEKILENTYRNINIALVNELAMLCHEIGINIWEVIEAARTKPYGFQDFYPGPGLGGHCIPLDPYYLSWKAREFNFHTSMIETAGTINDQMPKYCVDRCGEILNQWKKSINGSNVLVLGVAYKQNVDDYRESPALKVIELFENKGAAVSYYDQRIPTCSYKGKTYDGIKNLTPVEIEKADIVIIITAHSDVDYQMVQKNAKSIFDTRNILCNFKNCDNIARL